MSSIILSPTSGDARSSAKRLDIQVLRAIAVLLVIAYHVPGGWHLGGGFVGVDVFFAISGYVITGSILKSSSNRLQQPMFFFEFMRRRCRRLVPALSLTVVLTGFLIMFVGPADQVRSGIHSAVASLLFISNFWFLRNFDSYWNPELAYNPLLHMWSLAVEFQVYLVFPLIFIAVVWCVRAQPRAMQVRWLAIVVGLCTVVSLVAFLYLADVRQALLFGADPQSIAFYSPITRFWEFGAGAVVALGFARASTIRSTFRYAIKAIAIVVGVVSIVGLGSSDTTGPWVIPLIAATAVFLAIPTNLSHESRSFGYVVNTLVWVGDRSYSLYLWHWPFLALLIWKSATGVVPIAAALVATVVASDLSFRFIEQGRWPERSGFRGLSRLSRPAWAFGLAVVVLVGAGVAIRTDWVIHTGSTNSVATVFPPSSVDATAATVPMYNCGALGPETHCTNAGANAPEILIIGDSLGFRLLPAVQYVARQHGLNASMFWSSGCGLEFQRCPEPVRSYVQSHSIVAIVVVQNFDRASVYVNGAEADAGEVPQCDLSVPISECAAHLKDVREFTARAKRGIRDLTSISPHVLMALPFAQQALNFPGCLTSGVNGAAEQQSADFACGWTSVPWQVRRQGLFPDAIRNVVAPYPGVVLWDPLTDYCVDGRCPAVIDAGEVIMNDAIHMTMEASRFSIPTIEKFVTAAIAAESGT